MLNGKVALVTGATRGRAEELRVSWVRRERLFIAPGARRRRKDLR